MCCCVCSSCRFRLANVKKPLMPSTVTAQKNLLKNPKKDPATFSTRSSLFRTKCIQRPNCTHPIAQSERVKENERRGEMIECVDIDWMKLELCKCYRNKNNYTGEKRTHTFSRSQPNDNIVWIWKRTTKKSDDDDNDNNNSNRLSFSKSIRLPVRSDRMIYSKWSCSCAASAIGKNWTL